MGSSAIVPTKSERGLDKNDEDRLHPLADPPENTKPAIPERELSPADREAQFQLLVEAVQDYAIFMLDPAGNVKTWNAGARRIKQYTGHAALEGCTNDLDAFLSVLPGLTSHAMWRR
jgi:PAS domain-containing protein